MSTITAPDPMTFTVPAHLQLLFLRAAQHLAESDGAAMAGFLDLEHREDREGIAQSLRESLAVLEQLDGGSESIDAQPGTIRHLLDEVGRILAEGITDYYGYAPTPVGEVLKELERLRWVAEQAQGIEG